MTVTAEFDFTKSMNTVSGKVLAKGIGELPAPVSPLHPRYGLTFPLEQGAFAMPSGRVMSDAQGGLEIAFRLRSLPKNAALIQAWGQYVPLVKLTGNGLEVTHLRPLRVSWEMDKEYTLRLDWDCRIGMTARLQASGGNVQVQRRRRCWQAFGQKYLPFSVGGMVTAKRFSEWQSGFDGWVKSLVVYDRPQDIPGPVATACDGKKIDAPFPAARGITVLELDDPPIQPDPMKLDQLPDRLSDLRKTRRVCKLDALIAHCKNELEVFTMLTWHLGHMWPHSNYWPWPENDQRHIFWKRGHEILPDIMAGKAGGMCGGYAHMMEEVFWSLGFDARRIQVRGHSSFEAYSNQLDRWIICDASYNEACHLLGGPDGLPVGAREVIRAHERSEFDPHALAAFTPLICNQENLRTKTLEDKAHGYPGMQTDHYDSIGIAVNKTNQYGKQASTSAGDHSHAWYFMDCDRAFFTGGSPMGKQNVLVDELDDLYPSRNRTEVKATWRKKGSVLTLRCTPVGVTFFDRFEVEVDGKAQPLKEKQFDWHLHEGVNRFRVRTMNMLGSRGHPFTLTLHQKPQ